MRSAGSLEPYHYAWLLAHRERSIEWLIERLADGFHIHHVDGDHFNNDPANLVLIEGGDHIALHSGALKCGLRDWSPNKARKKREALGRPRKTERAMKRQKAHQALFGRLGL